MKAKLKDFMQDLNGFPESPKRIRQDFTDVPQKPLAPISTGKR